jgi:MFS superfamily sulfate permease-like transporter
MLEPGATGQWTAVPATPGKQTEPGLIIFRFGGDLFYANQDRFADEVRALVAHARDPVRWFVVDAGAITDIDYSAAQTVRELIRDLTSRGVALVFARVNPFLRADMDRHRITAAAGEGRIFATLHEAIAAVHGGGLGAAGPQHAASAPDLRARLGS